MVERLKAFMWAVVFTLTTGLFGVLLALMSGSPCPEEVQSTQENWVSSGHSPIEQPRTTNAHIENSAQVARNISAWGPVPGRKDNK